MLEDLIYDWSDFVLLVLIIGGVVPAVLMYVAIGQIRESRGVLTDQQRLAVGINLLVAVGAPVVALLLYYKVMSEVYIFGSIFCGAIQVAFLVAVIKLFREVLAARHWLQATGTVITSRVEARKNQPGDPGYDFHDTEIMNSPLVEYEYQVNGQSFRCRRITFGERTSEYELESILDRYPVGAHVLVYYNPADPQQAVLERDIPVSTYWIGGVLLLLPFGVPLVAMLIYHRSVDWLTPGSTSAGGAICLGVMWLATLIFAIALTAMCWQASNWPITRGRIVSAEVEEYQKLNDTRRYTYFKPSVVFEYEVNGRKYLGDRVRIAVVTSSNIPGLAGQTTAKYAIGSEVDVYYNPKKPSESVLRPWSLWVAFPWLIVAGPIAFACAQAVLK